MMKNRQQIGDIVDSSVSAINVNKQESKRRIIEHDNYFYLKIFIILVICVIVFWVLAVLIHHYYSFNIDINHIVITFIGVIATFVVISNYFQVSSIEKRMEFKINEYSDVIRNISRHIEQLGSKINEFDNAIHNVNQHVKLLQGEINNVAKQVETKIKSNNDSVGLYSAGLTPVGISNTGQFNDVFEALKKTTKVMEDLTAPMKKIAKMYNSLG